MCSNNPIGYPRAQRVRLDPQFYCSFKASKFSIGLGIVQYIMQVDRGFIFCFGIRAPSSCLAHQWGRCTSESMDTTWPSKIRGRSHVSGVTTVSWPSFGLTCCRFSSILNSLSIKNCKLCCCTRLYILFNKLIVPCILKLACKRWRSGRFSCPRIRDYGGGMCEGLPWWNYCADPENERAWNSPWQTLGWTRSWSEWLDENLLRLNHFLPEEEEADLNNFNCCSIDFLLNGGASGFACPHYW